MATKLAGAEREAALAALAEIGWREVEGRDAVAKTYRFKTFPDAMGWMMRAAFQAEAMNHHPEWSNVYARVEVVLTTHDVDGLSELDSELARRLDAL